MKNFELKKNQNHFPMRGTTENPENLTWDPQSSHASLTVIVRLPNPLHA